MAGVLFFEPAAYLILFLYAVAMSLMHARWDTAALAAVALALAIAKGARLVREARRVERGASLPTFVGALDAGSALRIARLLTFPLAWVALTFALARFEPFAHAMMAAFGWSAGLAIALGSHVARRSRLVVGGDGLRIEDGRRARFVPYADIAAVEEDGARAIVVLASGERVALRAPASSIEEAMQAARRAPESLRPSALARHGREPLAWVRALRELGGGADYRTARVPRDVLWATLEDPKAEPAERAAAAVALSPDLDDGGRDRLRVAAETSAEPRVRVAASLAAEDADEEALAEALHRCAEGERERS